jgi:hypothetical protein
MSHSPGSEGRASLGVAASARRTPMPSTRMTTSCAPELIAFARRMCAISAADLVRRARCSAERRYVVEWRAVAGRGGSVGNDAVCGSVWTNGLLWPATAAASEDMKELVCRMSVTSCVLRASERVGGGMDHIRSAGSAFGMKSVVTGSLDVADVAVRSRREEGTEQPVR